MNKDKNILKVGFRKRIYETVHLYDDNLLSVIYKYFMIFIITISLIPLASKESYNVFLIIDRICLVIYSLDFVLRWISADYKFNDFRLLSFVRYPFRAISIIDLLSILALYSSVFNIVELFQVAAVLKVFRVVRIFRYSKSIRTIIQILKSSKKSLIAVGSLAIGYIIISALIIFNIEPESFDTFFDAVYWATVSLTTVGYGDIYPITTLGRLIAMLSSFFGIAVVALPAGIVTAEFMKSFGKDNE